MDQEIHFERGDLTGEISMTLKEGCSLDDICTKYIHEYNKDRFEALAMRVYVGKENYVTIYATDKLREEDSTIASDKIAVKKFKLPGIPLEEIFGYIEMVNCTLTTNNYPLESMQVMNK